MISTLQDIKLKLVTNACSNEYQVRFKIEI